MKATKLKVSYALKSPSCWSGTYTSNNEYKSPNWTWYKDGKASSVNVPHVTIAFGLAHEVDKSGEWVGFHVSYPLSGSGKNARFNYKIQGGVVKYSNMTTAGFTSDALREARMVANHNWSDLDDFARAFYQAAIAG